MILGEDDEDEDDDGSRKLVKYTESTKNTEDTSEVSAKNDFFLILEGQCWRYRTQFIILKYTL